jgi:hypothetical protein
MQKFELVRRRPEFCPIAVHTLSKAKNGNKQILSVQFRNFILEGTWPRIMEVLFIRIIQATKNSFEGDTAAQMAASNAAEMINAAEIAAQMAASNADEMVASNAAQNDSQELITGWTETAQMAASNAQN